MDVIKTITDTFSSVAKTAVTKSTELVEVTKLKIAVSDAETEISRLMREIGGAVYESYRDNGEPAESIETSCAMIDEKFKEIEELRKKIREIRNVRSCEKCGRETDRDSVFCSKCGEKL